MEFSEFAGLLYPIIGGGDTTGRFTRKLFEKITDIPVSLFQVVQIAWQIADGDTFERAGRRTRLDLVRIAIRGWPPPARPITPPDDSTPIHVRARWNLRRHQIACQKNTAPRTPKQTGVGYPILPHIHMDGAENAGLRLGATPDRPVVIILLSQGEQSGRGHRAGDVQSPRGRIKPE